MKVMKQQDAVENHLRKSLIENLKKTEKSEVEIKEE